MNRIGLIGRVYPYVKFALDCVCIVILFTGCGTVFHNNVYSVYEVDEQPLYNGEEWQGSLLTEFNKRFVTRDQDNISRVEVEFIVDKKGRLIELKPIRMNGDSLTCYEKDVLATLKSCQKWTPAKKQGKPVHVKILLALKICLR